MKFSKPKASTVAICLALFIFFLILAFPFRNLKGYLFGQIYRNTGIYIIADDIYLSLWGWPGIGMTNVDVSLPVGREELDISCKSLVARVGLGSLFPPAPSISLSMSSLQKGGDLYVKVIKMKTSVSAVIDAEAVELSQLNIPGVNGPIVGKLDAEGDLEIDEAQLSNSKGDVELTVRNLNIPAQNIPVFPLPQFALGDVDAKLEISNGVIQFKEFQIGNPKSDFRGRIEGNMKLGRTINDSTLDLKLYVQLTEAYRNNPGASSIVSLLKSFERTPGDYGLGVNFLISEVQSNPIAAFPKKLLN